MRTPLPEVRKRPLVHALLPRLRSLLLEPVPVPFAGANEHRIGMLEPRIRFALARQLVDDARDDGRQPIAREDVLECVDPNHRGSHRDARPTRPRVGL